MCSTRCTCLRTGLDTGLQRLVSDPDCRAPSHLWDQINEIKLDARSTRAADPPHRARPS